MATPLHFSSYFPPPRRRLFLCHKLFSSAVGFPPIRRFDVCASSLRKSRKKKSDAELCDEIREFLVLVGLPEGHVPSIKELSGHGRNDLANLVRRRGYKVIRELLLANRIEIDDLISDGKTNLYTNQEDRSDSEENTEDHNERVAIDDLNDGIASCLEGYIGGDCSEKASFDSCDDIVSNSRDQMESADNFSVIREASNEEVDEMDNEKEEDASSLDQDMALHFSNVSSVPAEISIDNAVESRAAIGSSFQSESVDFTVYNTSWSTNTNAPERFSGGSKLNSTFDSDINSRKDVESSVDFSSDERVKKFIQNGCLDPILEENGSECPVDVQPKTHTKEQSQNSGGESLVALNESNARDPKSDVNQSDGNSQNKFDDASCWQEKQSEIKRLKQMLHQKELELSRLKQKIQMDKNALKLLQIEAENEISKAQKRILEKDAELQAAEDSLAGLKEVQIEYQGEGDIVEVAGSFNGWHNRIKMDPHPSGTSTGAVGSRKPLLWSTTLWLYPGKYEIKFVVDGHWRIDPQKESVTQGSITNNILNVER